jgi:hypothetical protein
MVVNLVYVPQMKEVADFFRESPHYNGENILSLEAFADMESTPRTIIIGRNGRYHHHDLDHIKLAKQKNLVPSSDLTSLVLFDRHTDYYYDRRPIAERKYDYLNEGCWVSRGVLLDLYSNIVMGGIDTDGVGTQRKFLKDNFCQPTEVMRWLDEVEIYPNGTGIVEDKYYPESESLLRKNPSVIDYRVIDGKYIEIRFKTMDDVDYSSTKNRIVVSTDLDVLNENEMIVDYWQGGLTTDKLINLINGLPRKIALSIVSGFTEHESKRTNKSMTNMSRILGVYSTVLSQSPS